ncbi:RNA polymerase sigma factor SigI [Oceanobacillus halophilus]|uniref:RNA polymerase sigma factor SigI n=1 Tax=Oceanobacillus halophilus TaxID=930130 RepID=A0A494ZXF8_9BACI|nr:RNA polymerase sigma factor SigI [Oceanobacillus halophilus]RKQ31314.1 RNA polymerase sigma factor SigI [Oceanobacillus halophilus]
MSKTLEEKPLEQMVISAQNGDTAVQNYLLKSYQPFIAKCVSEVCKRYINPKMDDEFSVGLSAFNEALFSYSPERGNAFLPFAKLVIKRKVIDYIRANQKAIKAVSLDESYDEVQMENPIEIHVAREKYQEKQNNSLLRDEILEFKEKLKEYKLSLYELTEISPKHRDARESAIHTARVLYEDEVLREYVYQKKKLPIKNLNKKVDVSKKTLERNRKFILAIFIVLSEDFIYLKDYLKGVGQ